VIFATLKKYGKNLAFAVISSVGKLITRLILHEIDQFRDTEVSFKLLSVFESLVEISS